MDADLAQSLLTDACRRFAVPGAQLGLMVGDERLVAVAGTLEAGGSQPVDRSTAFHAGSVTKSLAALVVVDAARRGEIDLDEPCDAQAPGSWSDTPRALMAQTTGRPNELPGPDEDLDGFIARVGSMPRIHPPGRFSYCNAGWTVLDALLQERSGAPFEELAADRVIGGPLTFGQPADAAIGHVVQPASDPQPVSSALEPLASAAGARWWTTADELLDYAALHLRPGSPGARVDASDVVGLRVPHAAIPGATVADAWGLGWALWDRGPHQGFGWAGVTTGHRAFLRCFPNEDAALVVLTNSAGLFFGPPGGAALFDDVLPAALGLLGVADLGEPARTAPAEPASSVAGRYGPLGVEAVSDDEVLLHAEAFGEPEPVPYHRVGGATFEVDAAPPGAIPIAFDGGLLYLGPMALPRVDAAG